MNDMEMVLVLLNRLNVRFINIDYHYIEVQNLNNLENDERYYFEFDEESYNLMDFGIYISS